jgi:prephenate dehydrogenase
LKVAVIGASGGMGSFFVSYFLRRGETVRASDLVGDDMGGKKTKKETKRQRQQRPLSFTAPGGGCEKKEKEEEEGRRGRGRLERFQSNRDAVIGCDVTILAVPMDRTLKVAKEIAGKLRPGSTLVEITSVKGGVLPVLKNLAREREVALLSIHPLFGPALETTEGMKIAMIVDENGNGRKRERDAKEMRRGERLDEGDDGEGGKEHERMKKKENEDREQGVAAAAALFPEARIIPMTRKQHDRTMAVILSLTHLLNIVYAATVLKFLSPEEFTRASTPNSSMQLTLAEAVLAQDADLSYRIQASNAYSGRVAREASRELKKVLSMIEDSDGKSYRKNFTGLAESYDMTRRAKDVIREIYSSAERVG